MCTRTRTHGAPLCFITVEARTMTSFVCFTGAAGVADVEGDELEGETPKPSNCVCACHLCDAVLLHVLSERVWWWRGVPDASFHY